VTGDNPVLLRDQREDGIARIAQIVDQPCLVTLAERDFLDDTDRLDITGRFKSHYHFTPALI